MSGQQESIACFSMEIAIEPGIPTYSGGLGILAGDTLRSAAGLKVPMVAVTLLHRKGYFRQRLDESGWQHEEPVDWRVEDFLKELPPRVAVSIEGRMVHLRAWQYEVKDVSGSIVPVLFEMKEVFCCEDRLNMTFLALNLSHYVNGVAKKHSEVTRMMFAKYKIDDITNGVHAATWTSASFQALFDHHIPGWEMDNASLRHALNIPSEEVWQAHQQAKRQLLEGVNRETHAGMDESVLTLGFARRAAAYKRGDLLFTDLDRIKRVAATAGKLQIIYAGKAHPQDQKGKEFIQGIVQLKAMLGPDIKMVYLENYGMELAMLITAGVDVWLNTPQPPLEASGTSGMKAALNGVPSLSILDGWWIEGCIEGKTGWAIGQLEPGNHADENRSARDAASFYDKLEQVVLPLFYSERERFIEVMRHCIALNGSFFNTHRMVQQYVLKAYFE